MREKQTVVVLAAGTGRRMGSDCPKQYMDLLGKPVIYYALKAFEDSSIDEIILVTGAEDVDWCQNNIVEKYQLKKVSRIVAGGSERYESVYLGLMHVEETGYVLIHDGARPLIRQDIIHRCIEGVQQYGACVAAVPAKDTIKVSQNGQWIDSTPERRTLWQMQTPQCFSASLVKASYEKMMEDKPENQARVTDDAMVVETYGNTKVHLIEGDYRNIKITTPEDLIVACALMKTAP